MRPYRSTQYPRIRTRLFSLALAALISSPTLSHARDRDVATERFTEYAQVISATPIYKEVRVREPRQECRMEQVRDIVGYEYRNTRPHQTYREQRHSSGNALVGSLVGGVIGNQLGRGKSSNTRASTTIAGAIIGGTLANEARGSVSRHRRHNAEKVPVYATREVERCTRVSESRYESHLQYYNVSYRYKGRTYTTRMKRDPGPRLELQVSVRPARH